MDFGKLPSVDAVDFSLPPEPPENAEVLDGIRRRMQVYVGATGYHTKAWVGHWYPSGTPERRFLACYGRLFNSIEFNATYYRIPDIAAVMRWRQAVPDDFRFCPKVPQVVSHATRLTDAYASMEQFCEVVWGLGNRLGCCFMQLPPHFGPQRLEDLAAFLAAFASKIPLAVEVRHPAFFADAEAGRALFSLLRQCRTAAVITDVAGRRDVCHGRLTARRTLIRFVGNALHPTDFSRTRAWAERLAYWANNGLEEVYFFGHEPDNLLAPELLAFCVEVFRQYLPEAQLRGPDFRTPPPSQQMTLFK